MPVLMSTAEFEAECARRRIDYDKLFEPRVTPEWLARFEEQVLEECRKDLAELGPSWQLAFERRVAMMNAAREADSPPRNAQVPEPVRGFLNAISPGVRA